MSLKPVTKNQTLSDKAYESIRNAIVFHELAPGDVLTEERLSEQLSISRTPIRTALHRLVDEGLAEVRGKSITVSTMSDEDIINVSRVRIHLELLVMEELRGKASKRLLSGLRDTIARQIRAFQSTPADFMGYIRQDYLFHTTLAAATGNKFLLDLTERVNTHSTRCLMLVPNLLYAHELAVQEHKLIVDCLEKQDYDGASKAMEHHLAQIPLRFKLLSVKPSP